MSSIFLCYEQESETAARIVSTATVTDEAAYGAQLQSMGVAFVQIPLDSFAGYLKLDGKGGFSFEARPDFAGAWAKTTIAPGEVGLLPGVPKTSIVVNGPGVAHKIEHPGGDLKLRFLLPGAYTVRFEAFPYRQHESVLTIALPQASA